MVKEGKKIKNQANLLDSANEIKQYEPVKTSHRFRFGGIFDKNIDVLKMLNNNIFPVKYKESFYTEVLKHGPQFSYFAYFNDIPVGSICCRLEEEGTKLYVMVFGVLKPYRKLGIGMRLYEKLMEIQKEHGKSVKEIYLHVQIDNEVALKFYEGCGFEKKGTVEGYYENVHPSDCFIVSKTIE